MTLDGPRAASEPQSAELPVILLAGNPNTGKTTLFNALSGESARVGNYPGITVERRAALIPITLNGTKRKAELVDLPGAYSLSARSPEERITLEAILGVGGHPVPQLVVVVVDAGQLARNFYLLLQITELAVPTVVAINMIDEVKPPPDVAALSLRLGVPCVATAARKGQGIAELRVAIDRALQRHESRVIDPGYPPTLLAHADALAVHLPTEWHLREVQKHPVALWALMSLGEDELRDIPDGLRAACQELRAKTPDEDLDMQIVRTRYAWIEERL